jgi:hypothetical protein
MGHVNWFGKTAGRTHFAMIPSQRERQQQFLAAVAVFLALAGAGLGQAVPALAQRAAKMSASPPVPLAATNIPSDVQLLNPDTDPTLRFPVAHSSLNWTLIKPRIRSSNGWLDISRNAVRYNMVQQGTATKEPDASFNVARAELTGITFEFNSAEFRDRKLRHFFEYLPSSYWQNTSAATANSIAQSNQAYTALILQALQNFDQLVATVKSQRQPPAPPPVVVQPVVTPPPAAKPPPSPPTVVVVTPSGAGEGQTVEVNETPLTIRGVTMDSAGLPTITINGAAAALRPKSAQAAEFWSDPIPLKPGDNAFEIVATNAEQAKADLHFVAHFTPKAPPPNPRALDKQQIISLLQGGVSSSRIAEIVKDRGIKFSPTPDDLKDLRAEGATDEVIEAIQHAAAK